MGVYNIGDDYEPLNMCPEDSLLVKAKLVGRPFYFWHYFATEDEVHGWVIGIHDMAGHLGYVVEWVTVNDELREGKKHV